MTGRCCPPAGPAGELSTDHFGCARADVPSAHAGAVPAVAASVQCDVAALAAKQAGVVSRKQLLALGLSAGWIRAQIAARRWQRLLPGVFSAFSGPVAYSTRTWAAICYAGEGAMASHETAAWLAGLLDQPPPLVHVTVPAHRRVVDQPGVRFHYSRRLAEVRHPVRSPPQTRIAETVIDLVERAATADDVVALLTRACQRRLTTASRLAEAAGMRSRLRWRHLCDDVLSDIVDGVQSPLERRYYRYVERAHGLPRGERNRTEGSPGRRRYRDVRYRAFRTLVELDGAAAHPSESRDADQARDNDIAEDEEAPTLRYGWSAVAGGPCGVAGQVARVLRRRGWTGQPRPCGPDCTLGVSS